VENIFNKTKSVSDDGKAYKLLPLGTTDEFTLDGYDFSRIDAPMWCYVYKGKRIDITVGYAFSVDSDNPDEAQSAFHISLYVE
jgi:hypothetical protein